MANVGSNDWQAESLRLTAFPLGAQELAGQDDWSALTGTDPELAQSRPRQRVLTTAGPFDHGFLTLQARPIRTDWRLTVNPNQAQSEPWRGLGEFESAKVGFADAMQKWLAGLTQEIKRLAFGAVLFLPVADRSEGIARIQAFLPRMGIDEDLRDIMIRLNRRRTYEGRIAINRIATWSIATISDFMIVPTADEQQTVPMGPARHVVRLELDINTAPEEVDRLRPAELPALWAELIRMGSEIAEGGDVP